MSIQRRRGFPVKLWPALQTVDLRGNKTLQADITADAYEITAAAIPQRSSRAEVPGQQIINVVRLLTQSDLSDVGVWSIAFYDGSYWDVVAPPAHHHGTRAVRHWSIDIRERP